MTPRPLLASFLMISQATEMLEKFFLTVLESAMSDHSNDTHKPYIFDNLFFDLTRGLQSEKWLEHTLNHIGYQCFIYQKSGYIA